MSTEQGPTSDQALSVLSTFLDGFNDGARSRGRTYFKGGRVSGLVQDGKRVRAEVQGTLDYDVVLAWANQSWVSQCSCPLEYDCKHAYATGLAWLRQHDRAPKSTAEKIVPMPLPLRPGEEDLVAEFTTATGQPPDRAQLAFLRNLQAVHRSLNHRGYSWFDHTALAALAPVKNRYQLQQFYQNPFEGWWQRAPATPLQLWPFVALLFTEHGIALPAFTAPFDHLATARQSRESVQREAELRLWRERFTQLEQLAATPPAPANQTSVRLRLGAKKLAWEISPAGPAGPFSALSANDLRNYLQDPVYCAQVMDEASNVHLTFLRANLHQTGRTALGLNDADHRTLLGHLLTHPLARTRIVGDAGEPIVEDDRALTWKIEDHPTDAARVIVRLTFSDGTAPPAPLHHLPGLPAMYLSGSRLFRGLPPLTDLPKKKRPGLRHGVAAQGPRIA